MKYIELFSSKNTITFHISSTFIGFTPLHKATKVGDEDIVHYLILKGANVNATNDDGDLALNLAAQNGEIQLWNTKLYNFYAHKEQLSQRTETGCHILPIEPRVHQK